MLKQIIHQISKLCKNSSFVNNRSYQDTFSSASIYIYIKDRHYDPKKYNLSKPLRKIRFYFENTPIFMHG